MNEYVYMCVMCMYMCIYVYVLGKIHAYACHLFGRCVCLDYVVLCVYTYTCVYVHRFKCVCAYMYVIVTER